MSTSNGMTISAAEATWGMIILFIVLTIVVFFFCCVPTYKALQARYSHWDDPENDPRWNHDQFQFSPTSPRLQTKSPHQYNRLSVCSQQTVSRGGSFRNTCNLPRMDDQFEVKLPPAYADICSGSGSSLGTPPAYTSEPEELTDKSDSDNNKQEDQKVADQTTDPKPVSKPVSKLMSKQTAAGLAVAGSQATHKPSSVAPSRPPVVNKGAKLTNKAGAASVKTTLAPKITKHVEAPKSPLACTVTTETEKPATGATQSAPPRKTYKKIKKNKTEDAST